MVEKIIDLYLNKKLSAYKISSILNISKDKVYYYLKKNNISRRSNSINSKKFFSDEYFFENIDSEEKAYWLGFIYADGFIISSRDAFGLSLSVKDESHIEKFLKSIKSNNKISRYFNNMGFEYSRIVIHSKKLKEDLIKNGCLENKTFLLKFPNIDKEYVRHFIRGYFDGDGSIIGYVRKPNPKNREINYRVSRAFNIDSKKQNILIEIQNFFSKHNIKTDINYIMRDDMYRLCTSSKEEIEKIFHLLYDDSNFYLNRKFNKFNYYVNTEVSQIITDHCNA